MLWFEDLSAANEPVLSFPVIGRISMKQILILGAAGMASYLVFSSTHGPLAAVPLCAGAILALARPKIGSSEWMALSVLRFAAGRGGLGRAAAGLGRLRLSQLYRTRRRGTGGGDRPEKGIPRGISGPFWLRLGPVRIPFLPAGRGRGPCVSYRFTGFLIADSGGTIVARIFPDRPAPRDGPEGPGKDAP